MLRIGLVGAGLMGKYHARVLHELEGVTLVGIADPNPNLEELPLNIPMVNSSSELIGMGIDAAVVAIPTTAHYSVAMELADSGVHTLVEKPISNSQVEAVSMAKTFEDKKLIGAVGHTDRYNPSIQALKEKLDSNLIGEVYQIITKRQAPFPERISDVGIAKDFVIHDIDTATWVLGSDYQELTSQTDNCLRNEHEDLLNAIGTLENSVKVSHFANWLSPFNERKVIVIGEKGTLEADLLTADLTYYQNGTITEYEEGLKAFEGVKGGSILKFEVNKTEPLRTEHRAFRDAILGIRDDIVSMERATYVLEIADSMLAGNKIL